MIISPSDILRMIVKASFLGQECLNVFHFRFSAVEIDTFDLEDVCTAWINNGASTIAGATGTAYVQNSVKVINLSQPFQPFFESVYSLAGTNGGANLPSSTTASFKLLVSTNKTKAGGKRLSGLVTSQVAGNALTSGGILSMNDFRLWLAAPFIIDNDSETETANLFPIVLKAYTTEFPSEDDYQDVTGCVLSPNVGTQNSRKVGYGS